MIRFNYLACFNPVFRPLICPSPGVNGDGFLLKQGIQIHFSTTQFVVWNLTSKFLPTPFAGINVVIGSFPASRNNPPIHTWFPVLWCRTFMIQKNPLDHFTQNVPKSWGKTQWHRSQGFLSPIPIWHPSRLDHDHQHSETKPDMNSTFSPFES